jgi:uncharacterized membrane protein YgcG
MNRFTLIWCLLAALLAPLASSADERILQYHSDVMVHANGEITVSENIRVRAEGDNIRRGIYRDFPTRYKDRFGNHYRVDFSVDSVLRDGKPESWLSEKRTNGIRVYIGQSNRFLSPGVYDYQVRYRTNRQLGFFADHDELWWNVTGNGWAFPIDHASARIAFPFEVQPHDLELSAFTGRYGSTESSATRRVIDARTVEFSTTRPLAPREGLSVIAAWPKGLIEEPSTEQKIRWFVRDNGAVIVLSLGLVLVLAFYYIAWNKVGRDPRKGVIIPRFEPPGGLSPAACRYVQDMSFDRHAFTAAIVSLAVKGHIQIEEEAKEFTLRRIAGDKQAALTKGESGVLEALLPFTPSSVSMTNANYKQFQKARSALKKALRNEYLGRLFHLNTLYLAPPIAITLLSAVIAFAFDSGPAIWIAWLVLSALIHGLFIWLMRAPTPAGRQVMDEIEGFRNYLDTAEQDRLDRMRSPALTPEVFESFLPYAYALGVENHWCDRFAREMPQEIRQQSGYQPAWYSGQYRGMHALNHLGGSFSSSLSTAISSSSSPPGSSSGGGGGGFSGGGGGGGGGGGW